MLSTHIVVYMMFFSHRVIVSSIMVVNRFSLVLKVPHIHTHLFQDVFP